MSQKKWKRIRREQRAEYRETIEWLMRHKPKWWKFRLRRTWKRAIMTMEKELSKI